MFTLYLVYFLKYNICYKDVELDLKAVFYFVRFYVM